MREAGTAPVARVPIDVSDEAVTPELRVLPVRVPAAAVTVMLAVPSKEVPLIVRAFWRAVAVPALPETAPVMVLVDVRLVKTPVVPKRLVVVA